jgi:hypothetical protein
MPKNYKTLGERQGGGDPDILKLKEQNRVRPLDNLVAEWRSHGIQHASDPDQFEAAVCPGPRSCPLCRKPVGEDGKDHFPVSRRFAANVWDYDAGSVKVLIAGPQVFNKFKEAANVGIDPGSCDWAITKTGAGLMTKYELVRYDSSPFTAAVITPDVLHDVAKYEMPDSTEAIFDKLERMGIDYDSLTVPNYTLEQAQAMVLPYTKFKGMTIDQVVTQEPDYADWLYTTKLENGALGDPIFLALQVVMEAHGLAAPLEEALLTIPDVSSLASVPVATTQSTEVSMSISDASANMVELISPAGEVVKVPPTAADGLLAAGFTKPAPPAPVLSSDANAPMLVQIGGQQVTLPRAQALNLIQLGTATVVVPAVDPNAPMIISIAGQKVELPGEQARALIAAGTAVPVTATSEPPQPPLPLPDEIVQVSVGGAAVPMPYVAAAQVVDNPASGASFVDPNVAAAHARVSGGTAVASPITATLPPSTTGSAVSTDPNRPFVCPYCTPQQTFTMQRTLSRHVNSRHKGATPVAPAVPQPQSQMAPVATAPTGTPVAAQTAAVAAANGTTQDRIKTLVSSVTFARDFNRLMELFEQETGKRNLNQMTDAELLKIEVRINQEVAKEAAGL